MDYEEGVGEPGDEGLDRMRDEIDEAEAMEPRREGAAAWRATADWESTTAMPAKPRRLARSSGV